MACENSEVVVIHVEVVGFERQVITLGTCEVWSDLLDDDAAAM